LHNIPCFFVFSPFYFTLSAAIAQGGGKDSGYFCLHCSLERSRPDFAVQHTHFCGKTRKMTGISVVSNN
jgi:hypothetical protein